MEKFLAQDSLKLALFSLEKLEKSVDKLTEKIDKMYKDNSKNEYQLTNLQDINDKMTEKIAQEITKINEYIEKINEEIIRNEMKMIKYENQYLKCQENYDERYVDKVQFKILLASEIEKRSDKKRDKVIKGAELIKTIIQLIMMISPYVIMITGYNIIKN